MGEGNKNDMERLIQGLSLAKGMTTEQATRRAILVEEIRRQKEHKLS